MTHTLDSLAVTDDTTRHDDDDTRRLNRVLTYADVGPTFGAAMPHGSCNAVTDDGRICGYPRRADGTCHAPAHHPRNPAGRFAR